MRPGLLFADTADESEVPDTRPAHRLVEQVAEDLGLSEVIDAMADGDREVADAARTVLLAVPPHPVHVIHRQSVLADCMREPNLARELYELTGRALEARRSAARAVFFDTPETMLNQSAVTLTSFVQLLRELRLLVGRYRQRVSSAGFGQLVAMVDDQFDDAYLQSAADQVSRLRLRGDILVSARLGSGNQSEGFVIRQPSRQARSLFRRGGRSDPPSASYRITGGDEAGHRALSSLRDQAVAGLAGAAVQCAQHVLSFFASLRAEVAFYLGCVNLRRALADRGAPVCLPKVNEAASRLFTAQGLYDPGLQLRLDHPAVANDIDADGMSLIMVTGANRGGKSTFLRSVGLAQLMAAAGIFVAATAFTTSARTGVFTHFTSDEDTSLTSGKLDEELLRMSQIADVITPNGMLLCNESFQSTNEREGSGIARHVINAMTEAHVAVVFVTHLYELANSCHEDRFGFPALFLRAERDDAGHRSFRLHEAAPQATSYGADLWNRAQRP
ncbi:MutS-related protein [Actinoplanes regularis]|uniref:MutS-related protein n=1 Tax=Actinoplanes regularis TaxID=52697 RepID=UPI0024A199CB|nr:hypothetical protein [Actinoplanes regularis]GLW33774.1 DNA mismatch repair protein MutS [Actinoplanes regularis]